MFAVWGMLARGLLMAAFALGVLMPAVAQDEAELEVDHKVAAAFVTPHTDWATPYLLGPTRVLFITPGHLPQGGGHARYVTELWQRFDLAAEMMFWGTVINDRFVETWHGGPKGEERITRLLGRPWDVFVFWGVAPEKIPLPQQYAIVKAVTEGAGLVLVGCDDPRILKEKNRLAPLPEFLADIPEATAFRLREGRGVRLAREPEIPYAPGWETAYDIWACRVGQAILWAAHKEPKLRLRLLPLEKALAWSALPAPAARLQWEDAPRPLRATIRVRREDGVVVRQQEQPLPAPQGEIMIPLPRTRAGTYYVDAIARAGKAVAAFACTTLSVSAPKAVAEIALARDWAEIGETLQGVVRLSEPPAPQERIAISLLDRRGRIFARQVLTPQGPQASFAFQVERWFPMLVTVRATLEAGGEEMASAWRFFRVVKRRQGRFNFVMWDVPWGNLAPYAEQALAETGVTVHLRGGSPPEYVAAYEIAWIPYTTRILAQRDEHGIMQPCCWNDEEAMEKIVREIAERHIPARQHGVFAYSLGDEVDVRGACLSPHCLRAYREYLQQQYGDIAALNASWGTNFKSFEEITLSEPNDNEEAAALRAGNFPRWFDRQAFQSYNFCRLCERYRRAFRAIDPLSQCGFEGAGTFGAGDDIDGFVRANDWWAPYPGLADEVLRSIAPPQFPRSNWMGYTKDADSLLEKYWRMITRGCNAVFWWRWDNIGTFHGWLAPNFDPYPANQEILRDTRIVREGLGDLLMHSEMETDGIGILYSVPSAYAARVQASPTYGGYEANHAACHALLRELGLNFRYFTDRQIQRGEIDLGQFKLICLPLTQALSRLEADKFKEFVARGGTLIADVRPAIYDGHVKPLPAGALDELFGVQRTGSQEAFITDGRLGDLTLPKIALDRSVKPTTAQALGQAGETPIALVHRVGQGRAILLNFSFASYPSLSGATTPEAAAAWLSRLLAESGVRPTFILQNARGERLRNVEITRWTNGPVQLVSVFRHAGKAEEATMRWPERLYVYDLKQGKAYGRRDSLALKITPYRAQFFAFSPTAIPALQLSLQSPATAQRGSVLHVHISSALPRGWQAGKMELRQPNGLVADWIESAIVVDRRGTTIDIPLAYNDPRGLWRLSLKELCAGQITSATFRLR